MKTCNVCGETKPLDGFYKRKIGSVDGYYGRCKECHKLSITQTAGKKEYDRARSLLTNYGITIEQYDSMYIEQEGKCKICHQEFITLHVDHSHETGKVRGLLCGPCNMGLGIFKDSTDRLRSAIEYLGE